MRPPVMDEAPRTDVVDLVFSLRGEAIVPDYADALARAVSSVLGWIVEEQRVGIHPVRGVTESGDRLMLSRRAQLVLRLPAARIDEARILSGSRLELGGEIEVGESVTRLLSPYHVLYSPFVTTGHDNEQEFLTAATQLVAAASIECKLIVGKRREAAYHTSYINGHSLMLHGLSPEHSLLVQSIGVGKHRLLGCGVFVPHKSIAPVAA
jgi:CRISPR-associated protein Cas6